MGWPHRAQAHSLLSCWISHSRGGQAIFHFSGVNSIEDAERYRGLEVQVPMADRVELPLGQYYISELIGCEIWEAGASAPLGLVRDVSRGAGTPLLEVRCGWRRSADPTGRGDLHAH